MEVVANLFSLFAYQPLKYCASIKKLLKHFISNINVCCFLVESKEKYCLEKYYQLKMQLLTDFVAHNHIRSGQLSLQFYFQE